MNSILNAYVKPAIRFVYYKEERAKVFREGRIKKTQDKLIRQYDASAKKLIVFLVPGADWYSGLDKISGGIISIVSLCEESKKLQAVHGAEVIMCTLPGQHLLLKHTQFVNNTDVFRFNQLGNYFTAAEEIIFHIPEFLCNYLIEQVGPADRSWMKSIRHLHINILNQNIKLMPAPSVIEELKNLAHLVTSTTAHQKYCNQDTRDYYQVPVHKFSVWISPEKYTWKNFTEKENLVIVSPDIHPSGGRVLEELNKIAGLRVQVIRNLTYEEYKQTISRAKWAVTFGEGLDGYIIEPVFSGAIGFAVFNEDFFTPDFKHLQTIYPSYEEMISRIKEDMFALDNEEAFEPYQKLQYDTCAKYYSHTQYTKNIEAFYKGNYSYK